MIVLGIILAIIVVSMIGATVALYTNLACSNGLNKLKVRTAEYNFDEAVKIAEARIVIIIKGYSKSLEDVIKETESRKTTELKGLKVKWMEHFREGVRIGFPFKDEFRIFIHIWCKPWLPPKPPIPKPPIIPPKPPKTEPRVLGIISKVDGTKTYIYLKFVAPKNLKLQYYIDPGGVFALKPKAEAISGGLLRLVIDAEQVDMTYGFDMEMLSRMKPRLIIWFEDKHGKPISKKPYVYELKPVTLLIDIYGEEWYIVENGSMYTEDDVDRLNDGILPNIEKSSIYHRIESPACFNYPVGDGEW